MTHCRSPPPALNVAPIADKPTLTTDPSMNASPEARMVVVSTQLGLAVIGELGRGAFEGPRCGSPGFISAGIHGLADVNQACNLASCRTSGPPRALGSLRYLAHRDACGRRQQRAAGTWSVRFEPAVSYWMPTHCESITRCQRP